MLIYLASPYSHPEDSVRIENYKKITRIPASLVAKGNCVYSPVTYGHHLTEFENLPTDWNFWMNFCLTFLQKCDKLLICKMPGWDKSTGVAAEIKFAEEKGIPIEYMEYLQ